MTRDDTLTLIAIAWLAFIVADVAHEVDRFDRGAGEGPLPALVAGAAAVRTMALWA